MNSSVDATMAAPERAAMSPSLSSRHGLLAAVLRFTLAYGVVPNVIFLALGHFVYLMRPVVNADYFLVAMIAPFVPGWLSFTSFAGLLTNELFINVAPLYHFQIVDAIRWLSELRYVSASVWLPGALAILVLSLGLAFVVSLVAQLKATRRLALMRRFRLAAAMFGLCFMVCSADILNGTSFLALPIHVSFADVNIAYSGVRRSLLSIRTLYQGTAMIQSSPLAEGQSASWPLLAEARAGAIPGKPQLALVVVESMGVFRDPELAKRLLTPLTTGAVAERYNVRVEEIPFNGHTIEAEYRELCGIQLLAYGEQGFPKCLPSYLNELGYETTGLHGFTNQFYNRYRWYPKMGFDHIQFAEEMQEAGITTRCGSGFKGICDGSVAEILHQQLLKPGKPQFVYWMTLNSHLPLDAQVAEGSSFDCALSPVTQGAEGPCLHSRAVSKMLAELAAVASDPKLPPTKFYVVGDHMPPFMTPTDRSFYSPTTVPAIVLEPRPQRVE